MSRKVFIWVAHPKAGSLCESLADAYQQGVEENGGVTRRLNLAEMKFANDFSDYKNAPALEPDLRAWQEAVSWADHIVIVHPYWWGAMPAQAKSVLDRALTPGFAYKYHARGVAWDKLLTGRTADAIITSDTPPWIDTLLYWRPMRRVLKNQILEFCGVKVKSIIQLGSVKTANEKTIQKWLGRARRMGVKAVA